MKSDRQLLEEELLERKNRLLGTLKFQVDHYDEGIRLLADAFDHIGNAIERLAEAVEEQNEQR